MARTTPTQQNFSAGELSGTLGGRFDLSVYGNGAFWLQNFIATTQGLARFRSGSKFVWPTRGNAVCRLVPFEFNTEQAYILAFTDLKMRIIKDGGIVTQTPQAVTAITRANPAVVTYAGADTYANGDPVILQDIAGMTEINNQEYVVANLNAGLNTFELLGVDSTNFSAFTAGGTVAEIVEVVSPYTAAELFDINYAQTTDTMYMVHPSHPPQKLTRTSHVAWTLGGYVRATDPFAGAGDYPSVVAFFEQRLIMAATNNKPQTLYGSVGGDYDDFTTGVNADDAFVYTVANGQANRIRWMQATEDFLAIGTAGGEFQAQGGNNDPITPTNITIKPPSYYGSASVKPVKLDSHILYIQRDNLTARSFEFDAIQNGFVSVNRNLTADHILVGRYGMLNGVKEVAFQMGNPALNWMVRNDGALVALTFEPKEQVNGWHRHYAGGMYVDGKNDKPEYGSVAAIPQASAADQLYTVVTRTIGGETVRYIEYFADQPAIPRFNDYFTGDKEADNEAYLQDLWEAQKRLFYVDSGIEFDGTVDETLALSAVTGAAITATAPMAFFTAAMVGREIWGKAGGRGKITGYTSSTVVTLKVTVTFKDTVFDEGEWYLTSNEFTGFEHLNGESVVGLGDGGVLEPLLVQDGKITTARQHSYLIAGLQYVGLFQSMDIVPQSDNGPGIAKQKGISNVSVKFSETLGARVGTDLYKMAEVPFRNTQDATGRPPPLFTGARPVPVRDDWQDVKYVYCVQDKPQPCNLQVFVHNITVNDA